VILNCLSHSSIQTHVFGVMCCLSFFFFLFFVSMMCRDDVASQTLSRHVDGAIVTTFLFLIGYLCGMTVKKLTET
jgi:hypothetical protein